MKTASVEVEYNEQLMKFAGQAMQGISAGIYSNPVTFEIFSGIATQAGKTVTEHLAEASFEIAKTMIKVSERHTLGKPIK